MWIGHILIFGGIPLIIAVEFGVLSGSAAVGVGMGAAVLFGGIGLGVVILGFTR